ncbi:MAG TPA: hypothetical protein VGR45_07340 [Stellaceae bacterium]|nr:hypothetical protein [Stellaceae bacterium]
MPDLAAQIACIKREIALRERVYPKFVASGRMKQEAADRELVTMGAVLATLEAAKTLGDLCFDEWAAGNIGFPDGVEAAKLIGICRGTLGG